MIFCSIACVTDNDISMPHYLYFMMRSMLIFIGTMNLNIEYDNNDGYYYIMTIKLYKDIIKSENYIIQVFRYAPFLLSVIDIVSYYIIIY